MKAAVLTGAPEVFALYRTLSQKEFEIKYLLTTVNRQCRSVSRHGIREELLKAQADSLNIPLCKIDLPDDVDPYD